MSANILVIDDNPAIVDLLGCLLKMFGYTLLPAGEAESGLEKARLEKPDLIVCDIQLPGINGYEFARQIKADPDLRSIPLLALTSYSAARDRDRALKAGFKSVIQKPIDPDKLLEEVAAFIPPNPPPASLPATSATPGFWWLPSEPR